MPAISVNLEKRITVLNSVLTEHATARGRARTPGRQWQLAGRVESVEEDLARDFGAKISFAHPLAEWTDDNLPIVETGTHHESAPCGAIVRDC